MRGHADDETIGAFREDLLPPAGPPGSPPTWPACPRCAEVDAQLAAVTAALARTPAPPMPASLAARLDAALAAEVAARSAAGASPATPIGRGRRSRRACRCRARRSHRGRRPHRLARRACTPWPRDGPRHTGPGHVARDTRARAQRPRARRAWAPRWPPTGRVAAVAPHRRGDGRRGRPGGRRVRDRAGGLGGGSGAVGQFLRRRRIRQRGEPAIRVGAGPRGRTARPHRRAPAGRQRHDVPGRPAAGPGGCRAQAPPRPRSRQRGPAGARRRGRPPSPTWPSA